MLFPNVYFFTPFVPQAAHYTLSMVLYKWGCRSKCKCTMTWHHLLATSTTPFVQHQPLDVVGRLWNKGCEKIDLRTLHFSKFFGIGLIFPFPRWLRPCAP